MSVWRAQEEISSVEFTYWCAFLDIDPDPDMKRRFEAAHIVSAFETVMSGKQVPINKRLIEYKPSHNKAPQCQSPEEIAMAMNMLANRVNKKLKKGK